MENSPLIQLTNASKVYEMGGTRVHALNGVNLSIGQSSFVAVMGPSGSGKSTLMNMIGCLDRLSAGSYKLDNVDIHQLNDDRLADIRNQRIGFVFQTFNLLPRLRAWQQVEVPLLYAGVRQRREKARLALEQVGLGDRIHHKPSELSGGQQQRVAIARALINDPAVILADEPTGNLDSNTGREIMRVFQKLHREKGITLVFVTHDDWIARHAERIIYLSDGKIVRDENVPHPLVADIHSRDEKMNNGL